MGTDVIYMCVMTALLCDIVQSQASSGLTTAQLDLFRAHGVEVTDDPNSDQWILSHSGVPNHTLGPWGNNPNEATDQNHMYRIPKTPVVAATPDCLRLGVIAVSINGVPFFNPYSGEGRNALTDEILDECRGHPAQRGDYHYHAYVPASCVGRDLPDELKGVSLDGYPIYGPLTSEGGSTRNLTNADLDICNGQERNGKYEYRLTHDFPYVLGCYHGVKADQMTGPNGRRKKRQIDQRPPPDGGPPPTQGTNTGGYDWTTQSCIYATFCENPADGCQCAAYVYDANAPRTSGPDVCDIPEGAIGAAERSKLIHLHIAASALMAALFILLNS